MNCKLVKDIEVGELVIAELLQVAYSSPMCAGLSANQIGIDARVIVIRNDYGQFDGYINPIMVKGEFPEEEVEQCMSYPGKHKMVEAFGVMEMLHMGGTTFLTGFRARVAQHELKHLDGKCPLGTILKRKK
jgi:peptide deformylase